MKYLITKNNFIVAIIENNSEMIYCSLTLDVGSVNEKKNEFGLAHFFEHMIFKGTKTRPNITLDLDKLGVMSNAYTSYDHTKYYIRGNKEDYKEIIDILLDLFLNPIFPEKDIQNERNVVIQELKARKDDSASESLDVLTEMLYNKTDTPYSIPVIGKETFISNFTRENLFNFYKNHYLPAKKIVTISSSIPTKLIIKQLEKSLNSVLKEFRPKFLKLQTNFNIPLLNKTYSSNQNKIIHDENLNQTIVLLAFKFVSRYNINIYTMELLSIILTNGFSSILFNLLRNDLGVTYYQYSDQINFKKHGYFYIAFGVKSNATITTVNHVLKKLRELKEDGVTKEQLKIAKKIITNKLIDIYQNDVKKTNLINEYVLDNIKPKTLQELIKIYNSITLDDIYILINKVFVINNLFIVLNGMGLKKNDIRQFDKL